MIRRLKAAFSAFADREPEAKVHTDPAGRSAWDYGIRYQERDAVPTVDDLIATKGMSLYREMEYDDAISSAMTLHMLARVAKGITFAAGGDEPDEQRAAELLTHNFEQLEGSSALRFVEDLYEAQSMGFACIVKTYRKEIENYTFEDGSARRVQLLESLRPLAQETIAIHTDTFGKISDDGVWQHRERQLVTPGYDPSHFDKYPRDRFVLFTFKRRWNNPYGMSALRPCYPWWFLKRQLIQWQARHLENFGMPFPDIEVPQDTSDAKMEQIANNIRRMIWSLQVAVRKKGTTITWPAVHGEMTAERRENIALCNRSIQRAFVLPSLLLEGGESVGSNALGQAHQNPFAWNVEYRGRRIEDEAFGEQIIREWTLLNFGVGVKQPRAKFPDFQDRDLVLMSTVYAALEKLGMTFPKTWMYETFGVPMPTDEEDTLESKPEPIPQQPFGGAPPVDDEDEDEEAETLLSLYEDLHELEIKSATSDGYVAVMNGNGKRSGPAVRDGVLVR